MRLYSKAQARSLAAIFVMYLLCTLALILNIFLKRRKQYSADPSDFTLKSRNKVAESLKPTNPVGKSLVQLYSYSPTRRWSLDVLYKSIAACWMVQPANPNCRTCTVVLLYSLYNCSVRFCKAKLLVIIWGYSQETAPDPPTLLPRMLVGGLEAMWILILNLNVFFICTRSFEFLSYNALVNVRLLCRTAL